MERVFTQTSLHTGIGRHALQIEGVLLIVRNSRICRWMFNQSKPPRWKLPQVQHHTACPCASLSACNPEGADWLASVSRSAFSAPSAASVMSMSQLMSASSEGLAASGPVHTAPILLCNTQPNDSPSGVCCSCGCNETCPCNACCLYVSNVHMQTLMSQT